MKTRDLNNRLVNGYLEMLKKLDTNSKLDLISKLSKSIKSDLKDKNVSFEKSFGGWDQKDDTEQIINEIRNSRSFNRKIENL